MTEKSGAATAEVVLHKSSAMLPFAEASPHSRTGVAKRATAVGWLPHLQGDS
jgi:hypothetical protein